MGCIVFSTKRTGHIEIGAESRKRISIGASMICTITQDDRVYLKDSLGNYLRDAEGRFLAAPRITI